MKCLILFSGKNIINLLSAGNAQRVVKVKWLFSWPIVKIFLGLKNEFESAIGVWIIEVLGYLCNTGAMARTKDLGQNNGGFGWFGV